MKQYLLGLDNGGTFTKAAIYDLNGNEIAVAGKKTDLIIPYPGFVERDINEMWENNISVIRDVLKQSGVRGEEILSIGITGFGNGLLMMGENGKPVYNAIISPDVRSQKIIDRWRTDGTNEIIYKTIGQTIWAGQPCALIAWMKENKPRVIEQTKWFMNCKDYIRYFLTDEVFCEMTDASGMGILDLTSKQISDRVLKATGLFDLKEKFAPIRRPDEICGYVTKKAAELTGLKEGIPVGGGLMDIHACALSCGITDEIPFNFIVGTWGIHQFLSKKRVDIPGLFMTSISYMPGYYMITEASPTCGNNLEWYIDQFLRPNFNADAQHDTVYSYCNSVLSSISPEDSDLIFLPFLFSTNGIPNAKACFFGLTGWHTKEHMLLAIYEGIVFSSMQHMERLTMGKAIDKDCFVKLAGGGSRNDRWMQMYADALNMPVEILGGTFERGAMGTSMAAGVACGAFDDFKDAAQHMVRTSHRIYPDAKRAEVYREKYLKYKRALKAIGIYSNPD